jgi:hypothetical protein
MTAMPNRSVDLPAPPLLSLRRRLPFALEVSLAVALKLALLAWLWHAFFSAPTANDMRMPTAQVEQHLLPPRAASSAPNHPSTSAETPHASH